MRQKKKSASKKNDLHGNAPDNSKVALLLIDIINDFEFPEGDKLFQHAMPMARHLLALTQRARQKHVPVIYANDNFGRWRSDFRAQVKHCLGRGIRGRPIVQLLRPEEDDYFVLKPKHSGFFSTTLDMLLEYLGVETLIITGIATNNCVLFTANDAYMRDYHLIVPSNCVAANSAEESKNALEQIRKVLKADVCLSTRISFDKLLTNERSRRKKKSRSQK